MGAKSASFWPAARGPACKVKLPNTYLKDTPGFGRDSTIKVCVRKYGIPRWNAMLPPEKRAFFY